MLRDRPASSSAPRTRVAISFGSPAGESGVTRLDLNELLIRHPQAAFLMRVTGTAMREAGIEDGDLALVDRALDPRPGQVVIAVLRDDFVCRRLCRDHGRLGLAAADAAVSTVWASRSNDESGRGAERDGEHRDERHDEHDDFSVWGVVTHVVRPVSPT